MPSRVESVNSLLRSRSGAVRWRVAGPINLCRCEQDSDWARKLGGAAGAGHEVCQIAPEELPQPDRRKVVSPGQSALNVCDVPRAPRACGVAVSEGVVVSVSTRSGGIRSRISLCRSMDEFTEK